MLGQLQNQLLSSIEEEFKPLGRRNAGQGGTQ
jgi:hypothetical protein